MSLKDLPWAWFRSGALAIRKSMGSVKTYNPDFVIPNTTIPELRVALREEHFDDNNIFSYYYKGEDLNVARAEYVDDDWQFYQVHVRAFQINPDNGDPYVELDVHMELDPTVNGQAKPHINEVNYSVEKALPIVEQALDNQAIRYRNRHKQDG